MNINVSKIVDEWSYRLSLIEEHDGFPDIESYSDLTVLKSVLTDHKWPVEITYELLYNIEHPESKLITEASFTYSILSNPGKGYHTKWLDYINKGTEFELEPYPDPNKPKFVKPSGGATAAKITKSILKSKGKGSQFTFEELLKGQGKKQDWIDWFGSNTNPMISTNKGTFPLEQISKSTFTGQKSTSGGATKPRDAAFYEQGICMAHAIINHKKSRKDAYTATGIDETKYLKYKAEVEDTVGNRVANNSKVKGLGLLVHTGKGGLGGVSGAGKKAGYVNNTPKTDIMNGERYSLKKAGGSQLMSGFKGDTLGVFNGAKAFWSVNSPQAAQVLDALITKIEDLTTGFTDDAIVGDSEVGAIKEAFRDFYLDARRPGVKIEAQKVLSDAEDDFEKSKGKKQKNLKALIKQLTGSVIPGKKSLQDIAIDKHIKAEAGALGLISRADNPDNIIQGVKQLKKKDIMGPTYFGAFLKSYSDKTLQEEAQKVLEKATHHKVLEADIEAVWASTDFKTWAVYEAATGNYKFSGDTTMGSTSPAMANYMFKFDVKAANGGVVIEEIDETWAGQYANKVKSNVGYKSTGRSKSSSWRLVTSGYEPEDVSYDGTIVKYKLNEIINEELPKLTDEVNLLVEEYINDIELLTEGIWGSIKKVGKKVYGYLEKLAKKLFEKIQSIITDFYNKVFKKLVENLKSLAKKGFDIFMDALGIEINGDIDYNSINIKL